jgi:hypothetical protein
MATRTAALSYSPNGNANGVLTTWSGLLNGDDGSPVEGVDFADRTMQVTGTFGTGGSVSLRGSNDGVNYVVLTDPQGNAITKTAAGIEVIAEGPRYILPVVTAGDGTTALVVTIWARRNR